MSKRGEDPELSRWAHVVTGQEEKEAEERGAERPLLALKMDEGPRATKQGNL